MEECEGVRSDARGSAATRGGSVNRLITGSILSFVVLSLAVVLLPLLGSEEGEPLLRLADRSSSHVLYACFLVVFLVLVLPGSMDRDADRRRVVPWASLTAYVLLFAAIPLIFTAYISGVSRSGLLSVAGICAAAGGLPLVLRRLIGARAGLLCWILGSLLLFAVPATVLYLESLGRAVPTALSVHLAAGVAPSTRPAAAGSLGMALRDGGRRAVAPRARSPRAARFGARCGGGTRGDRPGGRGLPGRARSALLAGGCGAARGEPLRRRRAGRLADAARDHSSPGGGIRGGASRGRGLRASP